MLPLNMHTVNTCLICLKSVNFFFQDLVKYGRVHIIALLNTDVSLNKKNISVSMVDVQRPGYKCYYNQITMRTSTYK